MKKSLKMLALPAALWAAGAAAQSNVAVYGIVDVGLVRESGTPTGKVTNVNSGLASGSRLGFKGVEDLGGGMKSNFVLENGFNADTGIAGQGGLLFGRQAFVGLSGRFGAVTLGRQYSPYYKALRDVGDPFGAVSLAGRAGNLMATNTRTDNMVEVISPELAGFSADLAYGAGETAGDNARNRMLGGALAYAGGPLKAQLAFHQINNPTATDHVNNTILAASYDLGAVMVHAAGAVNRGPGLEDSRDLTAGVTVPFGVHKVLFSTVRHDDRTKPNKDARQWGIAYLRALSRRTDLYASYATIANRNGASFKVGNATDKGTGSRALDLGLRHTF
ncbi:porin [Duganella caerulea]|uniref:porin n=1 Tax=Duganella caerulea TaxID=2885762 RepID=UPI004038133E